MSSPALFLHALGKHLAASAGSEADAGTRDESGERLMAALSALLSENAFPIFTFLDGEPAYENEALEELRHWEWSRKLAQIGVERLEVTPGTTREDLDGFVDEVLSRLGLSTQGPSVRELWAESGVRFSGAAAQDPEDAVDWSPAAPLAVSLQEETDVVRWLNEEVVAHGEVPVSEAAAVVRLLSVAMHSEQDVVVPLVELKEVDQYTTTHSMNVSCLSMALAEFLGYASSDVRAIGEAALLHDVGKSRIPVEVLNKTGSLTEEEWKLIQTHTVEGARILLASGRRMELAATVAYEHHLSRDGDGYPELTYRRTPHPASRLVQVCDIYDALRTRRPFRPPWPTDHAVAFLRERSADQLDPELTGAFLKMIRRWEPRRVELEGDSEAETAVAAEGAASAGAA